MREKTFRVILIFILFLGFFYRIYGLGSNYSFWTDEAATVRFGRAITETGLPRIRLTNYFSPVYLVTNYLTAFSWQIFGGTEYAARLPEVIFGTLSVLAVFLFGKEMFNEKVALGATILTSFSYIQIAWSRQARGYTIFEFFFLISLLLLYKVSQKPKVSMTILLILSIVLSIFTHTLGLILLPITFVYLFFSFRGKRTFFYSVLGLIVIFIFVFLLAQREILAHLFNIFPRLLHGKNFLSYYHSLFWRQYPLPSFLSFLGLICLFLSREKKKIAFFLTTVIIYLFFASFFLHVPFEKYVLVLFPVIFLLASSCLFFLSELIAKRFPRTISGGFLFFLLTFFIVFNGNKFVLKPKKYYSLNFDMREIPEIDYKKMYAIVNEKSQKIDKNKIAIIDIDADIPAYYLGEGRLTHIPRNDMPEKNFDENTGAAYIHSLEEFLAVRKKYPYGFIELVEHNFRFYPEGLVDYIRKNLTLEAREEYASFSPDWNRWPVELYSWGM